MPIRMIALKNFSVQRPSLSAVDAGQEFVIPDNDGPLAKLLNDSGSAKYVGHKPAPKAEPVIEPITSTPRPTRGRQRS